MFGGSAGPDGGRHCRADAGIPNATTDPATFVNPLISTVLNLPGRACYPRRLSFEDCFGDGGRGSCARCHVAALAESPSFLSSERN